MSVAISLDVMTSYQSSLPVSEVATTIEVEAGTSKFRVRCTSTGGRALNMAVSGANGYNSDISSYIQPVGTRRYRGNDRYTAITESIMSGGRDGDEYQCSVTSVTSTTDTVTLKGKATSVCMESYMGLVSNEYISLLLQLQLPH